MDNNEQKFNIAVKEATMYFLTDFFQNITNYTDKCQNRIVQYYASTENDFAKNNSFDEDSISNFRSGASKVVIILESPHKDEYSDKDGKINNPICANGQTGDNLEKHLSQLMTEMKLNDKNVDIAIINAIPYQCSQGVSTEILRDFVWLKSWYEFGYIKTYELLEKINPDFIVNCCTKGCHFIPSKNAVNISEKYIKTVLNTDDICQHNGITFYKKQVSGNNEYSLREFVTQCLRNYKEKHTGVKLYRCTHPCTWCDFKQANFGELA